MNRKEQEAVIEHLLRMRLRFEKEKLVLLRSRGRDLTMCALSLASFGALWAGKTLVVAGITGAALVAALLNYWYGYHENAFHMVWGALIVLLADLAFSGVGYLKHKVDERLYEKELRGYDAQDIVPEDPTPEDPDFNTMEPVWVPPKGESS